MFKVVLPNLSVNTVPVPPFNVVNATTSSTCQYNNPASKYAVVRKSFLSTSYVNTYPAPVVPTLSS